VLYTGKIFGYNSISGKSKEYVLDVLKFLTKEKYVIYKAGKFSLKDRNNVELIV